MKLVVQLHGHRPSVARFLLADWGSLLTAALFCLSVVLMSARGLNWNNGLLLGLGLARLAGVIAQAFRLERLWPLVNEAVDKEQLIAALELAARKSETTAAEMPTPSAS